MLQNFNWNVIQLTVTQLEKYDYNHERKKKNLLSALLG